MIGAGLDTLSDGEVARLRALDRYGVVDTLPEPAFDRIVDLARALFDTPVALVSFVDQTRQWFKARTGINITETSRAIAFCDHAIRQDDVMVVPDATKDDRFADNPLVTGDPGLRFYAGAPIRTPDGHKLGTVCILSNEPRELSAVDRARLSALAGIVAHELELRVQTQRLADLAEERRFLLDEMDHRLQNSLHLVGNVLQEQARQTHSLDVRQALLAAADRVVTVALISRELGRAGRDADETASDYLLSLCEDIQAALIDGLRGRTLRIEIDPALTVPPEQRARLGFIVSELIGNSVKHGEGAIYLHIRRDGDNARISIHDQGGGFAPRHSGERPQWGTGLRLVQGLSGGQVSVDPGNRRMLHVTMPTL